MPRKVQDISGQKFAMLTAVSFSHVHAGQSYWTFRCECGVEKVLRASHVKSGTTKSCGCSTGELMAVPHITHGHWRGGDGTPEYSAWCLARTRCHQPNNQAYKDYGARGITMCDRWRFGEGDKSGFECFIADMGLRPSPKHTLDRRDNEQGYSPENCRWATRKEQQRNRRTNRIVEYAGRRMTLIEAAELAGLTHACLTGRLNNGWSVERAMTEPKQRRMS